MSDERPTDEGGRKRRRSGWREGKGEKARERSAGREEEKKKELETERIAGWQEVELANGEPTGVICSFSHRIGQQRSGVSWRRASDAS